MGDLVGCASRQASITSGGAPGSSTPGIGSWTSGGSLGGSCFAGSCDGGSFWGGISLPGGSLCGCPPGSAGGRGGSGETHRHAPDITCASVRPERLSCQAPCAHA